MNDLAAAILLGGRGRCDPAGMSDNWDKDLPSEAMKAKVNRIYHVSFFRLDGGDSLDYLSVIYFIFRIGPGVGAGVDQEPGVGVGAGVGTAPP